jgi:hypothetical protein
MRASIEHHTHDPIRQEISTAVANGVRAPLAALRASMESLVGAFSAGDPRSLAVRGALAAVVRLGHEMQALIDYALPQPAQPLSCSLREILFATRESLTVEQRAGVLLAVEDRRARLVVDGPLLSRSIARLFLSFPLEARGPGLLRARILEGEAVFTVVLAAPSRRDTATDLLPVRSAVSALGAALARRDVERMGGRFSAPEAAEGCSVLEIRFPTEPVGQERA